MHVLESRRHLAHHGAMSSLIYWVETHLRIDSKSRVAKTKVSSRQLSKKDLSDLQFFKNAQEFDEYMKDLGSAS